MLHWNNYSNYTYIHIFLNLGHTQLFICTYLHTYNLSKCVCVYIDNYLYVSMYAYTSIGSYKLFRFFCFCFFVFVFGIKRGSWWGGWITVKLHHFQICTKMISLWNFLSISTSKIVAFTWKSYQAHETWKVITYIHNWQLQMLTRRLCACIALFLFAWLTFFFHFFFFFL